MNASSPIPDPALNGGLYNGDAFKSGAPWATVPVRPTSAYLTHTMLQSANPPKKALYQMQGGYRPGNNTDDTIPGLSKFTGEGTYGPFDITCIPCELIKEHPKPKGDDCPIRIIPII
jgi:hypothetical protein